MGGLSPSVTVSRVRRWAADPLPLLALVAAAGAVLAALQAVGAVTPPWQVPALLGVVAAGLALSGST
ncbi:hypothetical protein [Ornithinimicrobium avium]|uniref:Uncharacterized protein n=1 Tax=Ornithinimicrobium avium TaxID=2283195 RepID=A0A345NQ71_9MICO|nr:hypothetical protein [Ornithinimicrobium avium]AXH97179.1 hypothetical protein DV701_14590 [Ornithinimicrobium avium]